jgi:hypothetical protein
MSDLLRYTMCLGLALAGCSHSADGASDAALTSPVQLTCTSGTATYPPLEKACAQDSDCFVAYYSPACCSRLAVGLNKSSEAAFRPAEAACSAGFTCGCNDGPAQAEDGRNEDLGASAVHCDASLCRTYIP